jgi:hypothetical protein
LVYLLCVEVFWKIHLIIEIESSSYSFLRSNSDCLGTNSSTFLNLLILRIVRRLLFLQNTIFFLLYILIILILRLTVYINDLIFIIIFFLFQSQSFNITEIKFSSIEFQPKKSASSHPSHLLLSVICLKIGLAECLNKNLFKVFFLRLCEFGYGFEASRFAIDKQVKNLIKQRFFIQYV